MFPNEGRLEAWEDELREVERAELYPDFPPPTVRKKYPRGKLQCGHEFAALQWDWENSKWHCVQCREAREVL